MICNRNNPGFRFLVTLLLPLVLLTPGLAWQDDDREDPLARFQTETDTYLDLWRKGQYKEASDFLKTAFENSTDGVPMRWLYDRADLLFEQGRIDDAIYAIEWLHYRRPSPKSALQLALFFKGRGRIDEYKSTLERADSRYKRFKGEKDDTDNTIAIIRIREMLGENPRSLFLELLKIDDDDIEDKVKIHLAAGDLAWRKFDYALAAEHYEKALDLDQENLPAHAGLAECYWKSNDPRLEPVMEWVLNVNPVHHKILGIQAELALDGGKTEQAREIIEKALAVNPNSMRFLGMEAASWFLDDDLDAMRVSHQRALLYNSGASEIYRITGRIASRQYRFKEGAEFQRKALALDPDDHVARALYAFDLLRLGQTENGRRELERSFEADRFNVQAYNMLELLDTLATFKVVKRGPFHLSMPEQEWDVWGEEALELLNKAYTRYTAEYDVKLELPIYVQIFDNHDDFMVRSLGLPGGVGYLGICFGKLITMDSPSARTKGTMNWRATLWHEFVHVITLQKTRNRMPRWLSEGISVYEETREVPAWGQLPMPQYKSILAEDELPGLDDMELLFTQAKTQLHLIFGYFLGGEFVRFYAESYGHGALVKALEYIGAGTDTVPALVQAAAVDLDRVNGDFSSWIDKRLQDYNNLPNPEPNVLERLAGGGATPSNPMGGSSPLTDAMAEAKKAMTAEDWEEAERWLLEAVALFPEYVGDGSPLSTLAELYDLQDNTEKLVEILEKVFIMDGSSWPTCLQLARIYRDQQNWKALQRVSRRGLEIDPFDTVMRRDLANALEHSGSKDEALSLLGQLVRLDPNRATDYRLRRIDLLTTQKKTDKARGEALQLLEDIPYSWEAQQRLLTLAEGDGNESKDAP